MLRNFLNKSATAPDVYKWPTLLLVPIWVLSGFAISAITTKLLVELLVMIGVPLVNINQAIFSLVVSVVVYGLTLGVVMGLPYLIKKQSVTLTLLGLTRLPSWKDIGLAPLGFIIYFIATTVVMITVSKLVPSLNLDQAQNVGFDKLTEHYQYILAFLTLVVIAPIAEEILFRGYLYGKLRGAAPMWVAILATSLLFGFVHFQWNVGIDVFILSIVLCSLREVTGSIHAGILLHMMKNGIAFYFLFINPTLLTTLGG